MNQPNARTLTLFDLLARSWQAPAAVAAVRFNADGSAAAFACVDGAVYIAADPDPEPPEGRIRVTGDLGQITLRPRERDPAPLVTVGSLADGAPPLAAAGDGFVVGDGGGRVLHLAPDGSTAPALSLGGPVVALDHAAGVVAAADRAGVAVAGPAGTLRLPLPGVGALAVSADGRRVAAANAAQVSLLGSGAEAVVPLPGAIALAWRGDGPWLAAALGAEGVAVFDATAPGLRRLGGFPAPVRCLAWSARAGAFAASGAFRIAAWDARALPEIGPALVTGQPGLVAVEAVAAHPTRALLVAGYANGQVVLAEAGRRDALMLRQGGAAVTALAFSSDGRHLAIGDAAGGAAIASFPARMFK